MAFNPIKLGASKSSLEILRKHYHHFVIGFMALVVLFFISMQVVSYLLATKPLPQFFAVLPDNKETLLIPNEEPNLLPDTILRWASKAATTAYTFDFVNYQAQTLAAKPYFTERGWRDYSNSISLLLDRIVQNQLFVNGVVVGAPVISNEGPITDGGEYVWRVQIPFLVTYQSANTATKRNYIVILSIVRVPTSVNQQGIGIDQFVMV